MSRRVQPATPTNLFRLLLLNWDHKLTVWQVVREASERVLGLRPFDVQLIGGVVCPFLLAPAAVIFAGPAVFAPRVHRPRPGQELSKALVLLQTVCE